MTELTDREQLERLREDMAAISIALNTALMHTGRLTPRDVEYGLGDLELDLGTWRRQVADALGVDL